MLAALWDYIYLFIWKGQSILMNISKNTDVNMPELAGKLIYICGPLAGDTETHKKITVQKEYNNLYRGQKCSEQEQ